MSNSNNTKKNTTKTTGTTNMGASDENAKVKYILDKESDYTKKKVSEFLQQQFGSKATWQGDTIEVEKRNEIKVVEFFQRSKCNYRKAA